jgi:hypothetical protein
MSGAPRDPKSKQSGGDLKISLTPAGLFVVAMIVFLCRRNIRLRPVAHSLPAEQSISATEYPKIPCDRLFFQGTSGFCYPLGLT